MHAHKKVEGREKLEIERHSGVHCHFYFTRVGIQLASASARLGLFRADPIRTSIRNTLYFTVAIQYIGLEPTPFNMKHL